MSLTTASVAGKFTNTDPSNKLPKISDLNYSLTNDDGVWNDY